MKRVLIRLIVLAFIAAVGWFGFNFYVQRATAEIGTGEIEAAFERIRAGGGKASHGKVAFDPGSRDLTIEDIAFEPIQPSNISIKIASVRAVGVSQTAEGRFSADSIDVSGIEVAFENAAGQMNLKLAYKVPQITIRDYSGPTLAQGSPASDSLIDKYRFALEQFASVTASSIVAPTMTMAVTFNSERSTSGDITYSGFDVRNINRGKVEVTKLDRAAFTFNVQEPSGKSGGKPGKFIGEIANIIFNDYDATAVIAALDPQKATDDSRHRIYRHISAGPYTVTIADAAQEVRAQVGRFVIDDYGLQPSKLQPLLAMLPQMLSIDHSTPMTRGQTQDMMEKLAEFYEGVHIGKYEISDLSMDTPQGAGKLRAIRYDQAEFALEGLDAPSPEGKGRFKIERFALKSFSMANLMRWSAKISLLGQMSSPDDFLGVLRVLDGIELKGVAVPYKNTDKLVNLDTFNLNWGQFVGAIPSKVDLASRMVVPVDPSDPNLAPLAATGLDKLSVSADLGTAWTEASNTFTLAYNTDIGDLFKAQTHITLANVPRGVFSTDLTVSMLQAQQVQTGPVEFTLRDTGGVGLAIAEYARKQNFDRDAARRDIVSIIKAEGDAVQTPDAAAAVDAIARFIETPGQTLTIKLTPKGKLPAIQLPDLLKSDPLEALGQFKIEASTGK